MRSNRTICIFFEDLKKAAQKRIIEGELITELAVIDSIKVKSVRVEEDAYGYDEDPDKQEMLENVHAETNAGNFLLVWDCMDAEFQTIIEERQK